MGKNHKVKHLILKVADWIETLIAIFLVIMICVLSVRFVMNLWSSGFNAFNNETITKVLEGTFNLVIGVEFVRMLSKHSIGSIVEILLFSIARGMIVQHNSGLETVLLVLSLVLVMVIRKFLLLPADVESVQFKSKSGDSIADLDDLEE